MTESVNKPLSLAEGLFKELAWDPMVKAALASVYASYPWLATWPLGPIVSYLVNSFSDLLFGTLDLCVDVTAVPFLNDEHQKAFDDAILKLKVIAHDKGSDSDEFRKAREDAKAALSQFVSLGP